jgi:hypothetical protein
MILRTYTTITEILLVCNKETKSLTLGEEHRLRKFENWVSRKISGAMEHRRKRHNDELHDFYSSPNTIRVLKSMRMRKGGGMWHI